jgi:hypothetical protein
MAVELRSFAPISLAPMLALFIVSLTACASRQSSPSTATPAGAPKPGACALTSGVWICNPKGFSTGRIYLTGTQQIRMGSGGVDGQFFTLRLYQDSEGGRVPTWGSMFMFQNFASNSENTLVPLSFRYAVEQILFQYDDVLSKWVYLSRSGSQQIAPSIQGAGTSIGDHPGRESSAKALYLPANTETGVFGDDGGFFGPEGNGVATYYDIQSGTIQFCNYDTITTLAAFRCNTFGDWPRAIPQTAPVQVSAGGCTNFQANMVASGDPAVRVFSGYVCFINPGNSKAAYATWNSVYNEEIPRD